MALRRILVIGATGRVGRELVSQLSKTGVRVRAMIHHRHIGQIAPDIDTVRSDLADPRSIRPCLDGIDTVFLTWVAPPATIDPVIEEIARVASRIVFLSAPIRTNHPFFQQPNELRKIPEAIERSIESSGLHWTFLRPGMFAANALHWWAPQFRAGDVIRWPYLEAPTAPIHEKDVAAVAVRCLIEDGHAGRDYVLTGPESITQLGQISTIGAALDRSVRVEEMTSAEARLTLRPDAVADALLRAWSAAVGQPAFVTTAVAEVTGRAPRTLGEWARDHADAFRI